MIIEVIADSISDAKIAQAAGANRIELITAVLEGGLTPSYGLIESVCSSVSTPVNVMIRPHSRSFCYTNEELEIMVNDIKTCKELGAAGVVFGVLTEERQIDEEALQLLIAAANGLDITFHRAFDEVKDQAEALKIIQKYPEISRVLTSGGEEKAVQAIGQFQQLLKKSENTDLEIMPGAGLTVENLAIFLDEVEVKEIHFGSGVRLNSSISQPIDREKIKKIIKISSGY